jgi:hypothetical protein
MRKSLKQFQKESIELEKEYKRKASAIKSKYSRRIKKLLLN